MIETNHNSGKMPKEDRSSDEYWTKEFKRGVLKLVILGIITKKEHYGYELVKLLKEKSEDLLATEEGTIYPLLPRLEKDGFLTTKRVKKPNEREKKYYFITKPGQEAYERSLNIWEKIATGTKKVIDDLID